MNRYIWPSIKLTIILLIICSGIYPLLVAAIGKLTPGGGDGETIMVNGKVVGYANVGQKFTQDKYFWSRPSAADYNAASSAGSNKGPSNPGYLKQVQDRIDTFLKRNPGIRKDQIPSDMVTASGSGLDPDISPEAAYVQVKRVATVRGLEEGRVRSLVDQHVNKGLICPDKVNVLRLNVALDRLQ